MGNVVYFIQDAKSRVKIGYTSDLERRIAEHDRAHLDGIKLIRTIDGGAATERWLHRRFAARKIVGEWFSFDPTMMTVVPPDEIVARQIVKPRLRKTLRESIIAFDEADLFGPGMRRQLATAIVASFWEDDVEAFIEWARDRSGVPEPAPETLFIRRNKVGGAQ